MPGKGRSKLKGERKTVTSGPPPKTVNKLVKQIEKGQLKCGEKITEFLNTASTHVEELQTSESPSQSSIADHFRADSGQKSKEGDSMYAGSDTESIKSQLSTRSSRKSSRKNPEVGQGDHDDHDKHSVVSHSQGSQSVYEKSTENDDSSENDDDLDKEDDDEGEVNPGEMMRILRRLDKNMQKMDRRSKTVEDKLNGTEQAVQIPIKYRGGSKGGARAPP